MGERATAERMAARGCAKLRREPGVFLGIDGARLAEEAEAFLADRRPDPPTIRLAW